MKHRLILFFTLMGMVFVAAACASAGSSAPSMPGVYSSADQARPEAESAVSGEEAGYTQNSASPLPSGQQRLIIRTADMSIVAADTEKALDDIATLADSSGGWVVSSEIYQYGDSAKSGRIQIRIPSEGFQSVLDSISGMAVRVTSLNTSGQDVTEEFVDLNARLGNLEATAARLRTFMDEASTVEEALAVSAELSRVEGDIESYKGRMQYLQQSASFSSIGVQVQPDASAQPIQVSKWQPGVVLKDAVEALADGLQWLADAFIWLVIFALPMLVILAIPFVILILIIRRLLRRRRARLAANETAVAPPASDEQA